MARHKTSFKSNEVDLRLTSVEVIPELHDEFKKECISNPILSSKKLFNRAMYLYMNDTTFKDYILSCTDLVTKGNL